MNPSSSSIDVPQFSKSFATVASPSALGDDGPKTALSIVTPPPVTRKLLQEAKQVGVPAVWLQPGTYDQAVLDYARKEWPDAAIAGTDIPGTRGGEGWCVLVDGEAGMKVAGRKGDEESRL